MSRIYRKARLSALLTLSARATRPWRNYYFYSSPLSLLALLMLSVITDIQNGGQRGAVYRVPDSPGLGAARSYISAEDREPDTVGRYY